MDIHTSFHLKLLLASGNEEAQETQVNLSVLLAQKSSVAAFLCYPFKNRMVA